MNTANFKKTKYSCFYTYLAMSSVFVLPPVLFMTFRQMYGISYTLLGTLVLINYVTQFAIDLIFTFFAKYFNIKLTLKIMPLLTSLGLSVYALIPTLFPSRTYIGLIIGTIIFSAASGLNEVLMSPTVAAIPSDRPERDMSMLHSLYAYGVFGVVLISSLFFALIGREKWMYLTLFFAALPLVSFWLFSTCPIPEFNISQENASPERAKRRTIGLALCFICIFLGSASENTMTNWISTYMEQALGIPKAVGDIIGLALFAILLGITRSLYAKYGKNIVSVLLCSMIGAALCYLTAALSAIPALSIAACVITGICTSMLWPGTLIMMEEYFPNCGVAAYALLAAGGDFGASVAPQLTGVIIDSVSASSFAQSMATPTLTPEQIGMKVGMLVAMIFPILGTLVLIIIKRTFKKPEKQA